MREILENLNAKQLGNRRVIAVSYRSTLLKEVRNMMKYVSDIDLKMKTSPTITSIDITTASIDDLEELKSLYSRMMMRIRGIETKYSTELKKIDKLIVEKR